MITLEQILEKVKDIPSNVEDEDSEMHLKYLTSLSNGAFILDFGTGWGKLVISIALACPQADIYTFDPGLPYGEGYEQKVRNILFNHLGSDLHFEINNSYRYQWSEPLDCLSIDSSHTYEDTLFEMYKFYPLVKPGGIILMHDYVVKKVGVKQAVDEFLTTHPEYRILESKGLTTVIKKGSQ